MHNDISISKFFHPDLNAQARSVARKRLESLSAAQPQHFPPEAWRDVFEGIPQNGSSVTAWELCHAGAGTDEQWMLISFWDRRCGSRSVCQVGG